MPELLLELFSEEIPARMQGRAAEDLKSLVTTALVDANLLYEGAQSHATPRRLVLSVEGLPSKTADLVEERKGPRVDAPKPAIDGFLKSTGLKLEELAVQEDRKGKFYIAATRKPGRSAPDVIAAIVPDVMRKFPWPKSMRWGRGTLRWVRPLQSILCTFDGEVVSFSIGAVSSADMTRGHRFLAPGEIRARRFEDYAKKLYDAHVIVSAEQRAGIILAEAKNLAFAQGLELIEDEALLEETAGLVEWPIVLMGSFADKFLAMPPEVIVSTIKNHQKCFALRSAADAEAPPPDPTAVSHPEVPPQAASKGALSDKYILVANMIAKDGGKEIVRGNDKVIAARLADAKFFWDHDRKTPLADLLPKLDHITFHAKLGSQGQRVRRVEALAGEIAKAIGADVGKAKLAARLSKSDLVTGMVGEFPELQGLMGRYYALEQGLDAEVADAIRDHYKPQGPSDSIPVSKVGQAVALADKLDTLIGFWAIDEKPTGSKDPYALRRAALGIVRMVLEKDLRLRLHVALGEHAARITGELDPNFATNIETVGQNHRAKKMGESPPHGEPEARAATERLAEWHENIISIERDLLSFFADRLKVYLREQGKRHDLIDAVFALGNQDDLLLIVKRVDALSNFLDTDDGRNFLAGIKRATNILKIEEKKEGKTYGTDVERHRLIKAEEIGLHSAITIATGQAHVSIEREDFEGAMRAIAKLRTPVDQFFDKVTVNDPDNDFRENRLKLLSRIRAATHEVADFSRIEG